MADNVAITAGSGTTISTEEVTTLNGGSVSAQHIQRAAIAIRTADATAIDLPGDATNGLDADITRLPYDIADDSADSGNPVKVGGKAKAFDGTDPGSVSENDRVDFITDLNRRLYVNPVHPMLWSAVENNATAQTNNSIKAAPGAGLSLYVTDIIISTEAALNAKLVEDTGGTPVTKAGPYYFAANGGAGLHFVTPIKCTADKDLGYTTVGAGNCTIEVHGFTAP